MPHTQTRTLLAEHRSAALVEIDDVVRSHAPTYAMEAADAIEARLDARGSTIDGGYLVEIGVARLELAELDGSLRRGEDDVDVRRTAARMDDLLRRIENSIVAGARASFAA